MNLLSSALPGIRDIRAPLVAGYIWLLLAYLVWDPGRDFADVHGTAADIVDLTHTIGPIATAVAVSVAAFFIGALSQPVAAALAGRLRDPLRRVGGAAGPNPRQRVPVGEQALELEEHYVTLASPVFGDGADFVRRVRRKAYDNTITYAAAAGWVASEMAEETGRDVSEQLEQLEDIDRGQLREVWDHSVLGPRRIEDVIARGEALYEDVADEHRRNVLWRELVARARELADEAEEQLEIPATLLVGDQVLPFAEADRERAEAELRIGASLPLLALGLYLAATASPWWALLLPVVAALLWQGLLREDSARRLIVETIIHKDIPFTPFDKFEAAVEAAYREAASTGSLISAAPS